MATEKQTKSNVEDPSPFSNGAEKSYCLAYERRLGNIEPDGVYFRGEDCPFYVEEGRHARYGQPG